MAKTTKPGRAGVKKTKAVARKTKPSSNGVATPLGAAISKTQAVRNAWEAGIKKNADVVAWVAKEYGLEVHQNYPSIIKSGDKKSGKKSAAKKDRKPGATTKKAKAVAGGEVSGGIHAFEIASELIHVAGDAAEKVLAILRNAIR